VIVDLAGGGLTGPRRRSRAHLFAAAAGILIASVATSPAFAEDSPQAPPGPASAAPASAAVTASVPRINQTGEPVVLVVPLREKVPLGQVTVRIGTDDSISVLKSDFGAAIERAVSPQVITGLNSIPSTDGFIPIEALQQRGMQLTFDPSALELAVKFGASDKQEQTIGFGVGEPDEGPVPLDSSDLFAAYLSYQASLDWVHSGQRETGLRKPRIDVDVNGRLFRTISFENQLTYDGNSDRPFTRFASRAIYDLPNSSLRFSAGDQTPVVLPLQSQIDVGGLGVSKLLTAFHPDRVYSASAGQRITLNEPSTVTIVVNGVPARTIRLDSGTYSLQDLPLTGGANNVELIIEDAAGARRIVSFDFFQDITLLAPDTDEYDFHIGVRSDYDLDGRHYYTHDPVMTGFYRRGISDQLTTGANVQASRDAQQFGAETSRGSPQGRFTLDTSGCHVRTVGSGFAARLQYRYSTPLEQLAGVRRIDVLAEFRSRNFGGIERIFQPNPYSFALNARYSQPINPMLTAGAGIDYRKGRDGRDDRYALTANATYRLANGMNISGSVGYDDQEHFLVGATLFWRFGKGSLLTARYDSRRNDASVGYFHTPDHLLDTVSWGVEATHSENAGFGVNGTAIWRTNRGDLEIDHRAAVAGFTGDREEVTSLRARGAIAFSGGNFAVGRYLSDSFAIVSKHETLGDAEVLIGSRVTENAEARTGTLGPALVSLSSYSRQNLFYDVPEAPAGYDFGAGNRQLYPWLHAGFTETIGSEFNVTAIGALLDNKGKPVTLIAGTATRVGDSKSPVVAIFTNRQGRLGASGLAPGEWRIEAGGFVYEITIDKRQGPFVDLHELRPVGRTEKRP
jgi:outer membrane usher protein